MSCDIIHDAADGVTLHSLYFCEYCATHIWYTLRSPTGPWMEIESQRTRKRSRFVVDRTSPANIGPMICMSRDSQDAARDKVQYVKCTWKFRRFPAGGYGLGKGGLGLCIIREFADKARGLTDSTSTLKAYPVPVPRRPRRSFRTLLFHVKIAKSSCRHTQLRLQGFFSRERRQSDSHLAQAVDTALGVSVLTRIRSML